MQLLQCGGQVKVVNQCNYKWFIKSIFTRCSACMDRYCSLTCQELHWPVHSKDCLRDHDNNQTLTGDCKKVKSDLQPVLKCPSPTWPACESPPVGKTVTEPGGKRCVYCNNEGRIRLAKLL